jgi:hypothetical protein
MDDELESAAMIGGLGGRAFSAKRERCEQVNAGFLPEVHGKLLRELQTREQGCSS